VEVEGPRGSSSSQWAKIVLDDASDDGRRKKKKGRPDGRWQAKLEVKRRDEKERLTSKIEEMIREAKNFPRAITN
jgi:hypothetical protein